MAMAAPSDVPPPIERRASSRRVRPATGVHLRVVYERPRTRADCARVERPCHFVACRHNLFLDVVSPNGVREEVRLNYAHPGDMPREASCALDVAESGPHTLGEIAALMRISDERVRQIQADAQSHCLDERTRMLLTQNAQDQFGGRYVMAKKKTNGTLHTVPSKLPKGATEIRRHKEKLPVKIDEATVALQATELAKTIRLREVVLEEKREANSAYRKKLDHFDEKLKEHAQAVEQHCVSATVECIDYLLPNNEVQTVRTDTGEVVGTRTAESKDLQTNVPGTDDDDDDVVLDLDDTEDGEPRHSRGGESRAEV